MPELDELTFTLLPVDGAQILDERMADAQEAMGQALWPGHEGRLLIEATNPGVVALYSTADRFARESMLPWASGLTLDALGQRVNTYRLAGTAAVCTMRFSLAEPRQESVAIPKWTKATSNGQVYFATDEDAVINPGETSVDVRSTCTATGTVGNGQPAGTVGTLVDLVPYVSKVENLDESHGGEEGEGYDEDGDARFRERIRLAPESYSTAGPELGYAYHAKSADASIADVAVISDVETLTREVPVADGKAYLGGELLAPEQGLTVNGQADGFTHTFEDGLLTIELEEPLKSEERVTVRVRHRMDGRVRIVPLLEGGRLPDEEVLERVYDAVNDKSVRPMTDLVTVDAPTPIEYDIDLTYWTTVTDEAAVVRAVEGEGGAIETFVSLQGSVLGRDVNPDKLRELVMQAGAIRCDVTRPEHAVVEDGEVAVFDGTLKASHNVESFARWDK